MGRGFEISRVTHKDEHFGINGRNFRILASFSLFSKMNQIIFFIDSLRSAFCKKINKIKLDEK